MRLEVNTISWTRLKNTGSIYVGILCTVLIMSLCLIGLGLAAWQENLGSIGSVHTGDVDVRFTSVSPSDNQKLEIDASISGDGRTMSIFIDEVLKNDVIKLDYTVTNKGSVPVTYYTYAQVEPDDNYLEVKNTFPSKVLARNGESADGKIMIKAGDVEEGKGYSLDIKVHFKQWNEVP